MKKKLITALLAIIAVFLLVACSGKKQEEVSFFNWGGVINPKVIEMFEKETNIKVKYSEYDENEKMYTLVKNNPAEYDVVAPSEYMVEKMAKEGLLAELDHSKIPNLKKINSVFLNKNYDLGNKYSVPWFYGTLGIVYDKTKVDSKDMKDWDALFNEKYKGEIWMLNSSRDTMGVGYWRKGYSANSTNPKELEEVKALMKSQKKLVKAYLQDEIKTHMVNGNGVMALVYSGEANEIISQNKNLEYYIPPKSNVWIDGLAVVKGGKNYDNALKLINFLTRPDIAAISGKLQGSVVTEAKEIEPTKTAAKNKVLYPDPSSLKDLEVYSDLGDFTSNFEQAWEEVLTN